MESFGKIEKKIVLALQPAFRYNSNFFTTADKEKEGRHPQETLRASALWDGNLEVPSE
ncbi:MAG: hypothetical protein J6E40_11020 [Lachnospiraceae bacterium]|nr:hypothetical protein [Lachnospiraceae bacterium]